MRYGINGSSHLLLGGIPAVRSSLHEAEEKGFAAYWLGQLGLIESLELYGAHGDTGSTMELGTAVISTWERHPRALAAQALTTQALTGGRLILGIGLNRRPVVEDRLHMRWERPIRHMSEYLTILEDLLATGGAEFRGDIWSYEDQHQRPVETPPRVMLAALGTQMLKLAGRRTDGTILWCVGPRTIREHIAPVINEAAAAADRPGPAIVCSIPVWVTDEPDKAREFLAMALADYAVIPSYRAMLDIEGAEGLGDLSIVGNEEFVRDAIGQIAESGATEFAGAPVSMNPDEADRTMAVLSSMISG